MSQTNISEIYNPFAVSHEQQVTTSRSSSLNVHSSNSHANLSSPLATGYAPNTSYKRTRISSCQILRCQVPTSTMSKCNFRPCHYARWCPTCRASVLRRVIVQRIRAVTAGTKVALKMCSTRLRLMVACGTEVEDSEGEGDKLLKDENLAQ